MTAITQLRQAGVDLSGLMSVLSQHLYSTPTVSVRELVQNAHDSIVRRQIEDPNWQENDKQGRIDIIPNAIKKTLHIIDTGAGLTEAEIHQYLATVGVGYTRKLREQQNNNDQLDNQNQPSSTTQPTDPAHQPAALIGMFGLGFLSAFVLASKVQVVSTSYQTPTLGHLYSSSNAQQYSVRPVDARATVGTEVIIHLSDDHLELTNPHTLIDILSHYCALLSVPIYVHKKVGQLEGLYDHNSSPDQHNDQPNDDPTISTSQNNQSSQNSQSNEHIVAINPDTPPWRLRDSRHPSQLRKDSLAFASRFEKNFEPICTLFIDAQTQKSNGSNDWHSDLTGMLWVQDGATYGTSDNRNLSVFLRGMLLDDNARDLLPSWAGFVGGVIESNQLVPTASREDLQRDKHFTAARHLLNEALIQGLSNIAKTQPEAWRRVLRRHNEALLGASLCDERLFALLMNDLQIPTSQGDMTAQSLIHKRTLHIILDNGAGFEDMLLRALGIAVADGGRYAVVPFLRRYASYNNLKVIELGTQSGNGQLFQKRLLAEPLKQWLEQHLCQNERLIAASFAPASLPLIVVPDREQALKRRLAEDDKDKKISQAALRLARQFTDNISDDKPAKLYLNMDNPAIKKILAQLERHLSGDKHNHEKTNGLDNGQGNEQNNELAVSAVVRQATNLLNAIKVLLFTHRDSNSTNNSDAAHASQLQQALSELNNSIEALLSQPHNPQN